MREINFEVSPVFTPWGPTPGTDSGFLSGPRAALSQGVWNQTGDTWGLGPGPAWGPSSGTGSFRCLPPTGRRTVTVESVQGGFRAAAGLQARWRCRGTVD